MKYISVILFALITIVAVPSFGEKMLLKSEDNKLIRAVFTNWKNEQIEKLIYMEEQDCKPSFFYDNVDEDKYPPGVLTGFPDKLDGIIPIFANEDDLLDFVILFTPRQCDGGKAFAGMQEKVLFLSSGNGDFEADSEFISKNIKESSIDWEFYKDYLLGSKDDTILYGEALMYMYGDPSCCPSKKIVFFYDFKTGETNFSMPVKYK